MLPGIAGISGLVAFPPPITLINRGTFTSSSAGGTSYTFTAQPIGTASATRRVVVAIHLANWSVANAITAVTIGGISATVHAQANPTAGCTAAIASAIVPTGTTADVVITFITSSGSAGITVIAIDNLDGTGPTETDTDTTLSTNALSASADWQEGGFVVACATFDSTSTVTWAGVTERWDSAVGAYRMTGGDLFPTSTATSQTISATSAGSPTVGAYASAVFR